jgi:hypothetical protein
MIRVGVLAAFVFAVSALAADTSTITRLRQYGTYLQSGLHSTPDGDPANRWSALGAPLLGTLSGPEANHALTVFRLACASVVQPHAPSLQCETLLRHSR